MNASERNNYMYWDLVHGIVEEDQMQMESTEFREHLLYRAGMFRKNTNASMNPVRREQYEHLMELARKYRREREI